MSCRGLLAKKCSVRRGGEGGGALSHVCVLSVSRGTIVVVLRCVCCCLPQHAAVDAVMLL